MADPQHGNLRPAPGLTPPTAKGEEWPDRSPSWSFAPLAPALAALASGIAVDRAYAPFASPGWATWAIALGAAAALLFDRPRLSALALVGALAALGGAYHHLRWHDVSPDDLAAAVGDEPRPAWVRGHVEEVVGRSTREGRGPGDGPRIRTRFILRIAGASDGSSFRPRSGRAEVSVQGDRGDLVAGRPVQVAGRLSRVAGPLNPGEFDRRASLRAQGIRLSMTVDEASGVMPDPEGSWSWRAGALGAIRSWSRDRLVEGLGESAAPLASALVLGRREEIDPEVDDAFARTGTTHLLAVSGLQVQVMATAIGVTLVVLGVPRRPRYLLVGLAAVGYAVLVGGSPSVTRSVVMTVSFCAALFVGRQTRPIDALTAAGILTLLVNPAFLFDVGCQLSFLAVAALVWLLPAASGFVGALKGRVLGPPDPLDELEASEGSFVAKARAWAAAWATRIAAASALVWGVAAPLAALRFHLFSPVGVLLNIPLVTTTSIALLAGAFKLVTAALGIAPAAWLAGRVVWAMLRASEVVVRWGAAVPWGSWYTPGPPAASVAVFYGLLGLAAYLTAIGPKRTAPPKWLRRARIVAWLLAAGWFVPGWLLCGARRPTDLEADVLAVGHGLAVAIYTPEGKAFLYDCGKMDDPGVGRRIVAPAVWARGLSRLDAVFLSHADQDHFNGLPDVLDRLEVGEVVVAPGFVGPDNPAATSLMEDVSRRGIPVRTLAAPTSWASGSTRFEAVHPPADWAAAAADNARSLVLDASRRGRNMLLTGDLEQLGLSELLSRPEPDRPVDVLLAPHHGGKAANPPRLYEWARPRIVVASQKPPAAGSADALTPLAGGDIVLLRTWQAGAITLRWSPAGVVARGFLQRPRADKESSG